MAKAICYDDHCDNYKMKQFCYGGMCFDEREDAYSSPAWDGSAAMAVVIAALGLVMVL